MGKWGIKQSLSYHVKVKNVTFSCQLCLVTLTILTSPHFPHPTAPSLSSKKKSPSQLRRQEALLKSGRSKASEEDAVNPVKPISDNENSKENHSEQEEEHVHNSSTEIIFKCNQCDLIFKNNKGLIFLPPLPEVVCPIFLELRKPWKKVM